MHRCAATLTGLAVACVVLGAGCSGPPPSDAARREALEVFIAEYREAFPEVPLYTVEAWQAAEPDERPVLIDVRPEAERAVAMIPGAISAEDFDQRRAELAGQPVAAYCTAGYRSAAYAEELRAVGIDAANLAGGILAWTHAGLPVVDADGPTRRVHVYGRTWALVPEGYEAVY